MLINHRLDGLEIFFYKNKSDCVFFRTFAKK